MNYILRYFTQRYVVQYTPDYLSWPESYELVYCLKRGEWGFVRVENFAEEYKFTAKNLLCNRIGQWGNHGNWRRG
jgi:hypothetical protein